MMKQHQHHSLALPTTLHSTIDLQVVSTELALRLKKLAKSENCHILHKDQSYQNKHNYVIFKL